MAGLAGTNSFPFLFDPNPNKLSFSSLRCNFFKVRCFVSTNHKPCTCTFRVSVRYSGRPAGGSFRNDDDALDISTITSHNVRLIDEQQNMLFACKVGVVYKIQALQMAEDAVLDLVILSLDADPPVVRIMDYSKYRYELQKKKREQQKKSAAGRMDFKELKTGYNIDVHDYGVRLKAANFFLKDGDKVLEISGQHAPPVKVIVNLKGRENEFRNNAIELIRRFQNDLGELASEEAKNFSERNIFIILVPNKTVAQKAQEQPQRKEKSTVNEVSAGI